MKNMQKQELVLFVDDEPNILNAFKRQLKGEFNLICAEGGQAALDVLKSNKNIAVIVSDMRMPEIDGIKVLTSFKKNSPDTVRIMLTGYTDVETAIEAINSGNIFRFLTKPCDVQSLKNVLNEAIRQYQLITAEKILMEKTLKGSIRILIDLLSITNPIAFGRTQRIRKYMAILVNELNLKNKWLFEMASLLSQIGFITIPVETIQKYLSGELLTNIEKEMISNYPQTGSELLVNIPRLEQVGYIIGGINKTDTYMNKSYSDIIKNQVHTGSLLLKIVTEFDLLTYQYLSPESTVHILMRNPETACPEILNVLNNIPPVFEKRENTRKVAVDALSEGMILARDIRTTNAILLASQGQEISPTLQRILLNYYHQGRIPKYIEIKP